MLSKPIDELTNEEIEGEIEWLDDCFERYEEVGQGISSKENITHARLKAELVMRNGADQLLSQQQVAILRGEYSRIETIDPAQPTYGRLCATLDKMSDATLTQIAHADIKFMSLLARNRCARRGLV